VKFIGEERKRRLDRLEEELDEIELELAADSLKST
jgi:hypothetical protein